MAGPSSPPTRRDARRLNRRYPLRDYPDITHTVRSQYAGALSGTRRSTSRSAASRSTRARCSTRSCTTRIAPYTDGFISYSDGVQRRRQQGVWTPEVPGTPDANVRDILVDYARLFFGARSPTRRRRSPRPREELGRPARRQRRRRRHAVVVAARSRPSAPELEGNWRWQMRCSAPTTTPTLAIA